MHIAGVYCGFDAHDRLFMQFFCTGEFHGTHNDVTCSSILNLSRHCNRARWFIGRRRFREEVLRCSVLMAGNKYPEVRSADCWGDIRVPHPVFFSGWDRCRTSS